MWCTLYSEFIVVALLATLWLLEKYFVSNNVVMTTKPPN